MQSWLNPLACGWPGLPQPAAQLDLSTVLRPGSATTRNFGGASTVPISHDIKSQTCNALSQCFPQAMQRGKQFPQAGVLKIYIYHNSASGNSFHRKIFLKKEKFPYPSWLKPFHEQPAFIKASHLWGWDFLTRESTAEKQESAPYCGCFPGIRHIRVIFPL